MSGINWMGGIARLTVDSWSVYVVERASAIATQWPCAIMDECITTPFPRPLYEYELVSQLSLDDC